MIPRPKPLLVGTSMLCAFVLQHQPAAAAPPKDAAAMKLYHDAIESDYLGMRFGAAEKKLKQAIGLCGSASCSPAVLAQLHRELGVVYLAGSKPADDARREFAAAIAIDPNLTLLKDLATPEASQLFAEVKGSVSGAGSGVNNNKEELTHVPPKEAGVSTPLPLYAELADGMNVTKVQVHYKSPATDEWKTLDLNKLASGYGVELPCSDVGSTPGELRYFIQAISASGEPAATRGTRNAPQVVAIVSELSGAPPHLPGRPPPDVCGGATCAPGAPGCDKSAVGGACSSDTQCASGACRREVCAAESDSNQGCHSDADCSQGSVCGGGVCNSPGKKNWLSLAIQQDALFLPSINGACSTDTTYSCYDGPYAYNPHPAVGAGLTPGTDNVEGGFSFATARIMVGYDRVVQSHITLGLRVGFAFNHGPTDGASFLPLHGEARVAYWFGANPTARSGLRPFVLLSAGVAQIDAKRRLTVLDVDPVTKSPEYHLQAWRRAGQGFASLGGGVMYALSPSSGITAEIKLLEMFGASATGLAGQLGYAFGL